MYMFFLKLVVQDLARAREFYEALGFRADQHSSDERTVAMIVDDKLVITLVIRDAFAELVGGKVGHPSEQTSAVNCLSVSSRAEVDAFVAKSEEAGGTCLPPVHQGIATHSGTFADPDGHVWQIVYMEPVHVID